MDTESPLLAVLALPGGSPFRRPPEVAPLELAHLSCGHRWPDAPHWPAPAGASWRYLVVVDGSPVLLVGGETLAVGPGAALVFHPDCAIGAGDESGGQCRFLAWTWNTPPTHSELFPERGQFLQFTLDRRRLRRLQSLHAQCRGAVVGAAEHSLLRARAARLQIDLCLIEARDGRSEASVLIERAVDFLRTHLDEPEPVGRLCEHLQLSEASLKRLFHEQVGKSPREFAAEWRMRFALNQLRPPNSSVKAIAYALGYRHPNDFSRAFKRHYGQSATRMVQQTADEIRQAAS